MEGPFLSMSREEESWVSCNWGAPAFRPGELRHLTLSGQSNADYFGQYGNTLGSRVQVSDRVASTTGSCDAKLAGSWGDAGSRSSDHQDASAGSARWWWMYCGLPQSKEKSKNGTWDQQRMKLLGLIFWQEWPLVTGNKKRSGCVAPYRRASCLGAQHVELPCPTANPRKLLKPTVPSHHHLEMGTNNPPEAIMRISQVPIRVTLSSVSVCSLWSPLYPPGSYFRVSREKEVQGEKV